MTNITNATANNANGYVIAEDAHLQGANQAAPWAPRRPVYTAAERQARRNAAAAEREREEGVNMNVALHVGGMVGGGARRVLHFNE